MVRSKENYGGLGLPKFLYLSCLPSKIKNLNLAKLHLVLKITIMSGLLHFWLSITSRHDLVHFSFEFLPSPITYSISKHFRGRYIKENL